MSTLPIIYHRDMNTSSFQQHFAILQGEPACQSAMGRHMLPLRALIAHAIPDNDTDIVEDAQPSTTANIAGDATTASAGAKFNVAAPSADADVDAATITVDAVVDAAIWIYATAPEDDFFLLHGVTSAWAFARLLPYVRCAGDRRSALYNYVATLLGAYVSQGMPEVPPYAPETLARGIALLYPRPSHVPSWDVILRHTVALPPGATDEHVYKLVMVAYEQDDARRRRRGSDDSGTLLYRYTAARKVGLMPW